jgi:hypothetical protein
VVTEHRFSDEYRVDPYTNKMLHANLDLHQAFQSTLTDADRRRLDEDLTAFAKDIVAGQLLRESPEELRRLLSEGRISPLLFQWALVERELLD